MYTLRDMHNRRDQFRSDQAWRERTQNDPTSPGNWHRLATEEKIKKRALDEVNQRKLGEQKLKNLGQTDVARITGEAGIERQELQNLGNLDTRRMSEAGATERTGMVNDFEREKRPFNRFTKLAELNQNPAGMGTDYVKSWRNFQKDPDLNNIGQASIDQNTSSKYQPVKKYDKAGNLIGVNYYNASDGSFAYFDSGAETEEEGKSENGSMIEDLAPQKKITPPPLANINSSAPKTGAGSVGWLPDFAATNLVPAAQTFNKMALGGIMDVANTADKQSEQPTLADQILELKKQPRYKDMSDLELYRLITTNQGA